MDIQKSERAGVALEYVLVTSFAAMTTMILLGILANIAKKKISTLAEKFDVSIESTDFDSFKD